jgi:hypothetical protein
MDVQLTDKTAIVTGSTAGIGLAMPGPVGACDPQVLSQKGSLFLPHQEEI